MQQSCPGVQPPPGQASVQVFVVGSQMSEALAQQVPPQAAWPAGQQVFPAPQDPPVLAVAVPEAHKPEFGLHTQTVRESPDCIATLELGVLNPVIEIEPPVHDVTVRPAESEFSEFPACHGGLWL